MLALVRAYAHFVRREYPLITPAMAHRYAFGQISQLSDLSIDQAIDRQVPHVRRLYHHYLLR